MKKFSMILLNVELINFDTTICLRLFSIRFIDISKNLRWLRKIVETWINPVWPRLIRPVRSGRIEFDPGPHLSLFSEIFRVTWRILVGPNLHYCKLATCQHINLVYFILEEKKRGTKEEGGKERQKRQYTKPVTKGFYREKVDGRKEGRPSFLPPNHFSSYSHLIPRFLAVIAGIHPPFSPFSSAPEPSSKHHRARA